MQYEECSTVVECIIPDMLEIVLKNRKSCKKCAKSSAVICLQEEQRRKNEAHVSPERCTDLL